jgi:hypothetical protein
MKKNSITYFQLLSICKEPCLIALRATKEKLKASVSEILTEAFFISSNKGVTRSATNKRN